MNASASETWSSVMVQPLGHLNCFQVCILMLWNMTYTPHVLFSGSSMIGVDRLLKSFRDCRLCPPREQCTVCAIEQTNASEVVLTSRPRPEVFAFVLYSWWLLSLGSVLRTHVRCHLSIVLGAQ